jgi:hypothetical protein
MESQIFTLDSSKPTLEGEETPLVGLQLAASVLTNRNKVKQMSQIGGKLSQLKIFNRAP